MRCFSTLTIGTATAAALWVACGGAEILEADKPSSGDVPKKADGAVLPAKSPDAGARDPIGHLVTQDAGVQSSAAKDAAPHRDGSARSDLVLQIPSGPTSLGGLGNLQGNGSLPDFSNVPGLGNLPGIGALGGSLTAGGSASVDGGGANQASGAGFPDLINNIPGAGNIAGGGGLPVNGDFTDLIKNIPGAGNIPGLDVLGNLVKNDAGP